MTARSVATTAVTKEVTMEFGKVREIIEKNASLHWDQLFKPADIQFLSFDEVEIGGSVYDVSDSAKRLIGQRLGIPAPYLDRCPPDLQERNLSYWLAQQKSEELFCRFNGGTLRAIFTKRYTPMDNVEIIRQLNIPEHTRCVFREDESMMSLAIPDRSSAFKVAPDDELLPGVAISNSEVGLKTFSVSSYFLRIVCTNGLITSEQINQSFRHTSTKGLDNFYDIIRTISRQVVQSSEQFKIAVDAPAQNPMKLIENFGRHYQLTKKEIEHVQAYYDGEPDTMWAVINAFTAAANDTILAVERMFVYQRIGGRILALTK